MTKPAEVRIRWNATREPLNSLNALKRIQKVITKRLRLALVSGLILLGRAVEHDKNDRTVERSELRLFFRLSGLIDIEENFAEVQLLSP